MKWILETYKVKPITEDEVEEVEELCSQNKLYYQHCPPMATRESIISDLHNLPPKKTEEDKFYLGFYLNHKLVAVLDLILNYPKEGTAFVGFFMLDISVQGKGIGSEIFQEIERGLQEKGFKRIRLGYVKDNPQAKAFWYKNGFLELGIELKQELYTIRVLEKMI